MFQTRAYCLGETGSQAGVINFSEILLVLLINAYEGVCENRFIFHESVNIKKNVKTFGFGMLQETRFFVFYLHQENKKN